MKRKDTEHRLIFESSDEQGTFEFRVHRNCRQVQLESGIDGFSNEAYINVDITELKAIRDMLTEALNEAENSSK
jgi:hypothetical protein